MKKDETINFNKIRTYPIRERDSTVKIDNFAGKLPAKGASFRSFWEGLPDIMSTGDLKKVAGSIIKAHKRNKPVIFCLGAHVIKNGLNPVVISLMEKGIITAIALNGAGGIHDFETAFIGATGEDVASGVENGIFGMVEETGRMMNEAIISGVRQGLGAGRALGEKILRDGFKFREYSILSSGIELGIPVTIHIAIGADTIHQHPCCDGGSLGEASYIDFQTFTTGVSKIGNGGVMVNFGSAVIMPEIFLKALTISRNLGFPVKNFTVADFEIIPQSGVVSTITQRLTSLGGRGYFIRGDHELMMPLLAQAVIENL